MSPTVESQLRRAFLVVISEISDDDYKIAVKVSDNPNSNEKSLPQIEGDQTKKHYWNTIGQIVKSFGEESPSLNQKELGVTKDDNTSNVAIVVKVDKNLDAPKGYTFIPLTGAYYEVAHPIMQQAIVSVCMEKKVPLSDTPIKRRLQKN